MSPLAARLAASLSRHGLLPPGTRVAVAVSGGADSTAAWWLLLECAPALGLFVVGAVHLNHRLRGAESDADEAWCRDLAAGCGLPIHVEAQDVAALARTSGRSLEHEGRQAREGCFDRALAALGAAVLATGHTMDDQAETVLLRLARGCGPAALSGVRRRRGAIVRPLLDLRHADLVEYLRDRGLEWREDRSNADLRFERNRVRHRVLPLMAEALSGRVVEALARVASMAGDEASVLDALTDAAHAQVVTEVDGNQVVVLEELGAQPRAIQRRLVHRVLVNGAGGRFVGAAHVESVLEAATAGRPFTLTLPGQVARVGGGRLVCRPRGGQDRAQRGESAMAVRHLPVPGVLSLVGHRLEAVGPLSVQEGWERAAVAAAGTAQGPGTAVALVDAGRVGDVVRVRFRRPGDRLRPLGMAGHRKLQDLLVDRKVARARRDRVPLVVDAHDRIVWVVGHALSEDFRVSPGTTRVLLLQCSGQEAQVELDAQEPSLLDGARRRRGADLELLRDVPGPGQDDPVQ